MKLINLFSFVLFFVQSVNAQTIDSNLNVFFSGSHQNHRFNGNVLIAEDGKIVYERSFGYADFADSILNSSNTKFPIASITKTFTAIAILQLCQEGKLEITDPVKMYLPDFPYPTIQIKHLLSHTSGLQPYDNLFESIRNTHPDTVFTNRDLLSRYALLKLPLLYQPGMDCNYDNINYAFLSLIVQKISGMSFHDYLIKNIFLPAKMYNTFCPEVIFYHYNNQEKKGLANLYYYPNGYSSDLVEADTVQFIAQYWHAYNFQGFGEIVSTCGDILKFDQALNNGSLINPKLLVKAYSSVFLNSGKPNPGNGNNTTFGLGWIIENDSTYGKIVRASGGAIGLRATLLNNLSKHQTIVLMDNTQNETDDMANDAVQILEGASIPPLGKSAAREYGRVLVSRGILAAKTRLRELQNDSMHYSLNENEFNSLGYDFMNQHKLSEALETFKINTELFPDSWNVYDSYGEALLKNGQNDEAIKMYQKSVELNPGNENGIRILKTITKQK